MNSIELENLIRTFLRNSKYQERIYNEFSLQHELGFFLRKHISKAYKVEFERNTTFFGLNKTRTAKHEIDLVIYNREKNDNYAIELKYPTPIANYQNKNHGGYNKAMLEFMKDIEFMEELKQKQKSFKETYVLILVDDDTYRLNKQTKRGKKATLELWDCFRNGKQIPKEISTPLKWKGRKLYNVEGNYRINWEQCLPNQEKWFYLGKINLPSKQNIS